MKKNIHDLMNNIEDSSVELEERDVVSSERIKELTRMKIQNTSNKKHGSKKTILIVGIAAALVATLGISAYAAFNGGVQGLSFGKSSWGPSIDDDIKNSTPEREFISAQGYADSPEYQATAEWLIFEQSYDRSRRLLDAYDEEIRRTGVDPYEEYNCYFVWSQEMVDKIDEITAKYGLKIHTDMGDCDEIILTQKYGEIFSGDFTGGGYMYDDGTFQLDAVFNGVNLQIRRCMRGYFDTVYLNLGTTKNFEDYSYKTKSGVTVNISTGKDGMGNNRWIIAADLENSFVTLNIMPHDYDGNTKEYTKEDIQNLLDQIDFNKL